MRGRGDRDRRFPTAQITVGPYFLASHPGSLGPVWVKGVVVFLVRGHTTPYFLIPDMMLDPEQWEMVLQVYAGHPVPALSLSYQLIAIKQSLQRGQRGIPDAIAGLDLAIDALYAHTDFHKVGRKFFQRTIEGTLKPEQEEILRKLGVKI